MLSLLICREEIPLDDNSVDTVLLTYTLCTIPDTLKAMQNMRRVLKPGGKLVFRAWKRARCGGEKMAEPLKWCLGQIIRRLQYQSKNSNAD